MAVTPRTRPILKMLEPKAFPMLSSGCPSNAARPETSISGAEVPNPKISRPIIKGEILKILAILAPLSVKVSALHMSKPKPIKRDKMEINILLY